MGSIWHPRGAVDPVLARFDNGPASGLLADRLDLHVAFAYAAPVPISGFLTAVTLTFFYLYLG